MILTKNQIKWAYDQGYLKISDFDEKRLNPNSYNLRLADELMIYTEPILSVEDGVPQDVIDRLMQEDKMPAFYGKEATLDMKTDHLVKRFNIPETGYILMPGVLYLGRTIEYTETHKFVPMLEGRSSIGRLGIRIHSTAGFGDIGFCGYWTLEINCIQPVKIYPGVEIAQIYYHTICDNDTLQKMCLDTSDIPKYDGGKYQNNAGIQKSMLWREFV